MEDFKRIDDSKSEVKDPLPEKRDVDDDEDHDGDDIIMSTEFDKLGKVIDGRTTIQPMNEDWLSNMKMEAEDFLVRFQDFLYLSNIENLQVTAFLYGLVRTAVLDTMADLKIVYLLVEDLEIETKTPEYASRELLVVRHKLRISETLRTHESEMKKT